MADPRFQKNKYGLDPWGPIRQRARQRVAEEVGNEFEEADLLPTLVLRGMFSVLYRDELNAQKKRAGKYWSLKKPLPRRKRPVQPREWAEAYNQITVSFVEKAGTIKRPTQQKSLDLTSEGVARMRKYRLGDQRKRTERIEEEMSRVMDDLAAYVVELDE